MNDTNMNEVFDVDREGTINEYESALMQTYYAEAARRETEAMMPAKEITPEDEEIDSLDKLDEEYRRQVNSNFSFD